MDRKDNVTEQLKVLLEEYHFNVETVSKLLELPVEQVKFLAEGNVDFLPEDAAYRFRIFNKIAFLYLSAVEDKSLKLCAFLQVLISYHGLSKKTIAKMSGVEGKDIDKILSNPPKKVSDEIKFKVAVTVMALRFLLKDCEPKQ